MSPNAIRLVSLQRRLGRVDDQAGHREEAALCKARGEASQEDEPTDTLTLDLQPPKLWEIFVVRAAPFVGFLTATLAESCRWNGPQLG